MRENTPADITVHGVEPELMVCGNCNSYQWGKDGGGNWDRHIGTCACHETSDMVLSHMIMYGRLHALTGADDCPRFQWLKRPEWPISAIEERKDAEVAKDRAKVDLVVRAVKAKMEEAVRDKNRCCWEKLEIDELLLMMREHLEKFEERGCNNRRDAVDLVAIGMMLFHKCTEGDFKYFTE